MYELRYPKVDDVGIVEVELVIGEILLPGQVVEDIDRYKIEKVNYFTNAELDELTIPFGDVKNAEIDEIPNNTTFEFNVDDVFDELMKEMPYPFNWVAFFKLGNDFFVRFSSCTPAEIWEKKWSREPFFIELIYQAKVIDGVNIIELTNWSYEDGRVIVEIRCNAAKTINEALIECLPNLNEIIYRTENSLAGLTRFQKVLDVWNTSKLNHLEEFWQETLLEHSWVIAQCFSIPIMIIKDKAYVGGTGIDNKGSKIIDFLYKNSLTQNITLIEIKTPQTSLVGSKYRDTYSVSNELSGAINQALQYKDTCIKDYYRLISNTEKANFKIFNPRCMVIIGTVDSLDEKQRVSFEIFRNELKTIEILTFDELFEKISVLLKLTKHTV